MRNNSVSYTYEMLCHILRNWEIQQTGIVIPSITHIHANNAEGSSIEVALITVEFKAEADE